jgi:hypothetical protein
VSARVTGVAAALSAVNAVVEGMGREWSVDLDLGAAPRQPYRTLRPRVGSPGAQPTNGAVVDHLAAAGRDPFKLTPTDRATIARDLVGSYRQGLRGAALYASIASSWRTLVVQRMRAGTAAPAVSAAWADRKARLGYPTTSSVASGQLVRAIESALPRVRKVR